jgi:hypothetical protein
VGTEKSRMGRRTYRVWAGTRWSYGSSSSSCVRSTNSVTPCSRSSCTAAGPSSARHAHGWRPAISRPFSITVGGRTR